MHRPILAVTGDTHGEKGRFLNREEPANQYLTRGDYLFICGDFGFVFSGTSEERRFLGYLAEKIPYTICFCDGNHENFPLLNAYEVSVWKGGKVHILEYDSSGNPKVIHLMRGQIYEIEGKKIFVFGGAFSIDKYLRTEGISWWPEEMPSDAEMEEAVSNLEAAHWEVDYILTHAAPEDTMSIFHPVHTHELPLNGFLEFVRERTKYRHWYMGHLHRDEDVWRHQSILWFSLRDMSNNEEFESR